MLKLKGQLPYLADTFWNFCVEKVNKAYEEKSSKRQRSLQTNVFQNLGISEEQFVEQFILPYSSLSPKQLSTIAELQSIRLFYGEYQFSVKLIYNQDALHWLFVYVYNLGVVGEIIRMHPNLGRLSSCYGSRLTIDDFKHALLPVHTQCHWCGVLNIQMRTGQLFCRDCRPTWEKKKRTIKRRFENRKTGSMKPQRDIEKLFKKQLETLYEKALSVENPVVTHNQHHRIQSDNATILHLGAEFSELLRDSLNRQNRLEHGLSIEDAESYFSKGKLI